MYNCQLPIGEPIFFEGQYTQDRIYPLYIQMICCSFEIKPNKIPTIQIKNNRFAFKSNEYLETSADEIVCLVLTNVDLKLFFEHYYVNDLSFICGWKFKSMTGLFKNYIDKWIEVKNQGTLTGNEGQRTMAKLMLNSLYGKFATTLETKSKYPYMGEDEIIHYTISDLEDKEGVYLPLGSFVTAWARDKTIRSSQEIVNYSLQKTRKKSLCILGHR